MKKLLIILAVLLLGTINVFSQEQTRTLFDVYFDMGNDAYENGNYESAIAWFTKASEFIVKISGEKHPSYATTLNNLAVCYDKLGDYTIAIELHNQALKIRKTVLGEAHPDYANSLHNLGSCYYKLGDYNTVIKLEKQASEVRKIALGETHPDYATSLYNLALSYYRGVL